MTRVLSLLLADLFCQIVAKSSLLECIGALHDARLERGALLGYNLAALGQNVAIWAMLSMHRLQVAHQVRVTCRNRIVLENLYGRVAVLMSCPQIVHDLNLSLKTDF